MSDVMQRWIEVYEREADGLIRFASTLVGPDAAYDAVSDAMVRLIDRPETGRLTDEELPPYLYRTVANTAKNHLRSSSRRSRREEKAAGTSLVKPGTPSASDMASQYEQISPEVANAMGELSVQQRAVIFLTYWFDLTPAGVAAHLNVSTGTVKRQLARGRSKLGKALSQ